jgi:hypothetical protein
MSSPTPQNQLRKIFVDIINGYSSINVKKFGNIYVKHMDFHTSSGIDEKKDEYFERAKSKGLPTSEEKEKDLMSEGLWSVEKDKKIQDLNDYLNGLNLSKSKMMLKKDIDNANKEVEKTKGELNIIEDEKIELMGFTADIYASKKVNECYIFETSYKSKDLSEPAFSEEDFDELTDVDIGVMAMAHNTISKRFQEINLKRVSLAPFFMNHFYLCEDDPLTFYGKPIIKLTFNQCDVFAFGKYFKHILSEMKHKPSPELMQDPDKLIDLFNVGQGAQKALDKANEKEGTATTFVGATKEDMDRMGISTQKKGDPNVVSLSDEAAKKGGKLNMEELIKLHGV